MSPEEKVDLERKARAALSTRIRAGGLIMRRFRSAAHPAAVLSLLAENAALEEERARVGALLRQQHSEAKSQAGWAAYGSREHGDAEGSRRMAELVADAFGISLDGN